MEKVLSRSSGESGSAGNKRQEAGADPPSPQPRGPLLDLLSVPGKLSSSPPTEAMRLGPLFRGRLDRQFSW